MSRVHRLTYDDLPMFADDASLSAVFMGPGKCREWQQVATLLEGRGLPTIDALMGGRYKPAVKAFFDREYRLATTVPASQPDGVEDFEAWQNRPKRRKRQV